MLRKRSGTQIGLKPTAKVVDMPQSHHLYKMKKFSPQPYHHAQNLGSRALVSLHRYKGLSVLLYGPNAPFMWKEMSSKSYGRRDESA